MPRNDLIQIRRDTAANWTSVNPILAVGEQGFETDTGKFKIGTGSTAWNSLLYATDASDITGATLAVTDDITRGGVSLPRGVMAFNKNINTDTSITSTEEIQITSSQFTAVANRYYKITYYEPAIYNSVGTAYVIGRIKLGTSLGVAALNTGNSWSYGTLDDLTCVAITTLSAGTTQLIASLQSPSGGVTSTASRSSTQYAFLLVEDIGAV